MAEPTHNAEKSAVPLLRIEDMLTPEEQADSRRDLALMAKQRRAAEAFAAGFVPGASDRNVP